jgi:hypothetical protein
MHAQGGHALLQRLSQKSHIRKGKCMMLCCMQPEGATTADVGLVRTGVPNGWESLLQDNSNASKSGEELFSLRKLTPQKRRAFPRYFFAGRSRDRTCVYYDLSFSFGFKCYVHARPGSSNCRALIQRSYCIHTIGSEIIGTAFSDWAFQLLYQLGAPRRA